MPYLAHFGLKEHPFTLTPNTKQYYPIDKHVEIIQSIQFGIARNTGILKVVGDVGTGKTMLCRLLLRRLVEANDAVAYLNAPQVDPDALVGLVAGEFGLESGTRAQMLQDLNAFLLEQHALGRNAVLIVDEAQALGTAGLEAVRLLSNLETERNKLLQIVMFGQSELDDLLGRPELRQINQRIGFAFTTGPLTVEEAVDYVTHRIAVSRIDGVNFPIFTVDAMKALARSASFVPRVINILADKALLVAYGEGSIQVTRDHVELAVADSPQIARPLGLERRWIRRALVGVIAAEIAIVVGLFTFSPRLREWTRSQVARVASLRHASDAAALPASTVPASTVPASSSQASSEPSR